MLRNREAGLFLAGAVVSGFGTTAMWLVAGVWVKSLTGSDSLAALTAFAMWLPLLFAPLLGTLADRVRRGPLLIGVRLATAVLLLPLLAVDSAERVWILFAVLVLYGAGGVIHDAAETALVPSVVDRRLLGDFNGLRMTAKEGTKLVAPLVGAGLFVRFGGASVALLDAASFVLAAGICALTRVREPRPRRPARTRGRTAAGARSLWRSAALRPLIAGGGATMLLAGLNGAMTFAVADTVLDRSPAFVGVLYTAQGVGSVLVGLVAGPLLRRLPERTFAAAGTALFAVGVALRALPYEGVALVSGAAVGAGLPCVLIAATTAVQRETDGAVLGGVAATASTLLYAPNAVALAAGAGLVAVVDVRVLLAAVGAAGAVTAAGLLGRGGRGAVRPNGGSRTREKSVRER
ncbi:MFS transporter [Streptomyces sp. NPDC020141]|uniref:MFS transporter n=1 Tax=Streptomyces sp. NPDC020141 TaxID=3365065 RepID=UPI0037A86871